MSETRIATFEDLEKIKIPNNISELNNDSGFIDKSSLNTINETLDNVRTEIAKIAVLEGTITALESTIADLSSAIEDLTSDPSLEE